MKEFRVPQVINFRVEAPNLAEANRLFLRAVGLIRSFNDSLVGKRPNCNLSIDYEEHVAMRKFRNEAGLKLFVKYMAKLVKDSPRPRAKFNYGEDWFNYKTANGNEISLHKLPDGTWKVSGNVMLLSNVAVMSGLMKEGFDTCIT